MLRYRAILCVGCVILAVSGSIAVDAIASK
jgi:hypothetical protein